MRLDRDGMLRLLRECRDAGAGDLFLKVPGRPCLRVRGRLVPTPHPALLPGDTFRAATTLMQLAGKELPLALVRDAEFGFGLGGIGRFRVQLCRQRGSLEILVHRMAVEVPTAESLGLDPEMTRLPGRGELLLVAGPGRRELLAALVDRFNRERAGHVVLLEDLLEYLHADRKAAITQREVGIDTESWSSGLRAALRRQPDLLAVGDVVDRQVAEAVLRAAEQGTAVLACVAAGEAHEGAGRFASIVGGPDVDERMEQVLAGCVSLGPGAASRVDAGRGGGREAA